MHNANRNFMTIMMFVMTSFVRFMTMAPTSHMLYCGWSADKTLCTVQTIQQAAEVWMRTAGEVMCKPELCRNFGCGTILDSLFFRDPNYEKLTKVPKHVRKQLAPFSQILTTDWGQKASHKRDTDGDKITAMLSEMLQGQLEDTGQVKSMTCLSHNTALTLFAVGIPLRVSF